MGIHVVTWAGVTLPLGTAKDRKWGRLEADTLPAASSVSVSHSRLPTCVPVCHSPDVGTQQSGCVVFMLPGLEAPAPTPGPGRMRAGCGQLPHWLLQPVPGSPVPPDAPAGTAQASSGRTTASVDTGWLLVRLGVRSGSVGRWLMPRARHPVASQPSHPECARWGPGSCASPPLCLPWRPPAVGPPVVLCSRPGPQQFPSTRPL